ncbi:hypothetical protein [uncultured Methanoregula sp.]|uniref:hypothetical protein n=1 Tax=uncultured Methanoregula sp. TaxID=1005933 RepID=UPI002AAB1AFE|nr:hypothetical protein [uncultured Methanoregula sp.]
MTETPDNSAAWHRTTILLRADIFEKARSGNIDIDTTCNRALAELLGMDPSQQILGANTAPVPVVVAPDITPVTPVTISPETRALLHPVINANDPTAVRNMLRTRKKSPVPVTKAPAGEPPHEERRNRQQPEKADARVPESPAKAKKPSAVKRGKDDATKQFIAEKVTRGEPDDARISKDEMYSIFTRWCHAMRIVPVPERRRFTLTLKNHFALSEKSVDGVPCWLNVRIK